MTLRHASRQDAKIAVTGPNGRLGSELVRRGCIPVESDVTNGYKLNKELLALAPDAVIHCAAMTNVDMCEYSSITATMVNAGGTMNLAQVYRGKIVYISTDYIFDGEFGPYYEEDDPNPLSIYGWSKLGGEIAIRNRSNEADLIVRTTVLFDKNPDNFVTKVIKRLLDGETVSLPFKLYGSPTYVPHLVEALLLAVQEDIRGTVNIAGLSVVSRFDFGEQIAGLLNIPKGRILPGEVTGVAPRPLKAGLLTTLAHRLGLPLYSPLEGVKEVINALETVQAR